MVLNRGLLAGLLRLAAIASVSPPGEGREVRTGRGPTEDLLRATASVEPQPIRAKRVVRRVLRAPLIPGMALFILVVLPSAAQAVSCSFFALTDDQTRVGPAPLTVHVFSIHATASDLNEWDGLVRFAWWVNGPDWQEWGTARLQGAGVNLPGFDLTFEQPGEYDLALWCAHLESGSTFTTETQTVLVQGPGGDFSDPVWITGIIVFIAVLVAATAAAKHAASRKGAQARERTGPPLVTSSGPGYRYETPPPTVTHEIPPSAIGPGGLPIGGIGIHYGLPPPRAPVRNPRRILEPGRVCFEWDSPGHDPSRERLRGYTIYRLQNGPDATVAQKVPIATLLEGATLFCEPFQQTYRYSTGGDIEGYVIEPIYESLWGQTQGQVYPGESTTVRLPIG